MLRQGNRKSDLRITLFVHGCERLAFNRAHAIIGDRRCCRQRARPTRGHNRHQKKSTIAQIIIGGYEYEHEPGNAVCDFAFILICLLSAPHPFLRTVQTLALVAATPPTCPSSPVIRSPPKTPPFSTVLMHPRRNNSPRSVPPQMPVVHRPRLKLLPAGHLRLTSSEE